MLALTKEKETLKVWHFSYIYIYSYEIHFLLFFMEMITKILHINSVNKTLMYE